MAIEAPLITGEIPRGMLRVEPIEKTQSVPLSDNAD